MRLECLHSKNHMGNVGKDSLDQDRRRELMEFIYESPANLILAALFSTVAVGAARRGRRLFLQGLRAPKHPSRALWIVRGIRAGILALAMGILAGGVLYANKWLLIFGVIFLAEELYETGVVIWALRLPAPGGEERKGRGAGEK